MSDTRSDPRLDVRNRLREWRLRAGLSQQALADDASVARQTIGGIENGDYALSLAVALRLARALDCRVDSLFWLDDAGAAIDAAPAAPLADGDRVTLAQINGRWVAWPLSGEDALRHEFLPADATVERSGDGTARVSLLDEASAIAASVAIAGCTPALSLWSRAAERSVPGVRPQWRHATSGAALNALARGLIHIAGVHVGDHTTVGNDSAARSAIGGDALLATLGVWDEGFALACGNPKAIRSAADLARPDVRLVNRETGAGARSLLDDSLAAASVASERVTGYSSIVRAHVDVARTVAAGNADTGVVPAAVARSFGLDFLPLRRVRYDLALSHVSWEQASVRALLETLEQPGVRRQLAAVAGYDTTETGAIRRLGDRSTNGGAMA